MGEPQAVGNRELVAPASCVTRSELLVTSAELGLALAQRVSWRGLRGGKGTWGEAQLCLSCGRLYSQEEPWEPRGDGLAVWAAGVAAGLDPARFPAFQTLELSQAPAATDVRA